MSTAPTGLSAGTPAPADRAASGPGSGDPGQDGGDACPGALRLHTADDGALARVRVPGGVLSDRQADALARAAERLGDGVLHLTSRGNVQLRGLGAGCGRELAGLLDAAGLLPSPRHERVRNAVASPLSGLDGLGAADIGPWLRELDGLLCASETAHALSGRFLFALDDGRGDVAALGADVTLTATPGGGALLRLGSGALSVPGEAAARAALTAAEVFLDAVREVEGQAPAPSPGPDAGPGPGPGPGSGSGSGTRAGRDRIWRVAELPARAADLLPEVARRLALRGVTTSPARPDTEAAAGTGAGLPAGPGGPPPGLVPAPDRAGAALSVLAPLGRISAGQWRLLAECARTDGRGELRLTPWRGVVVPGVTAAYAAARLAALSAAGLIAEPDSPWLGVGACVGRPGCAKALADVRADAATALGAGGESGAAGESRAAGESGGLPVYWSGCERRCGRPPGDRVDVVAAPEGYRISVIHDGLTRTASSGVDARDLAASVARARKPAGPPVGQRT
ncbi:cobalamin biosynthesis protein CobG [Streptomyces sp. NPDC014894]|uniref:cobalamin biosynthesis protein CobG n=1 Tax=Streptomyces sp. NPDC014894 TaxID=3364931 RepID=UPI0036FCE3AB